MPVSALLILHMLLPLFLRQRLDHLIGAAHGREERQNPAEQHPMGLLGRADATVFRNNDRIAAVSPISSSAFDHPVGSDSGEHEMGDALGLENAFQRAGIKSVYPRFGEYEVRRFRLEVSVDFGAPRTVL